MLESLGYSEAPERARGRPDPVQHVLDPRVGRQPLHRAPRRGEAAEARAARADRRRRRLLGAVGQGGGVRALPVRRRGVRPGPGAQAGRVPDERLADGAGLLRVRGLHGPPAGARARAAFRAGCRSAWAATAPARTASSRRRAGARSAARCRSCVAEAQAMAADGVREVTLLGQNVNSYGRDLPALRRRGPARRAAVAAELRRAAGGRSTRSRGSSGSATRARTRRTCART